MATATRRKLGPADNGQRMTLDEFLDAEWHEGWLYELARGVVVVTEVPGMPHGMVVWRVSTLFGAYEAANPDRITYRGGGMESRIRLPGMQSDRHPDQAVYLTHPPRGPRPWARWVPAIVVEVVSRGGEHRDYVEKREEYLRFGVLEYWIFDRFKGQMLVLRREGDTWREVPVSLDATYETELLPGLVVRPGVLMAEPSEEGDEDPPDVLDPEEHPLAACLSDLASSWCHIRTIAQSRPQERSGRLLHWPQAMTLTASDS
jgi:Uma2 family endonuclease